MTEKRKWECLNCKKQCFGGRLREKFCSQKCGQEFKNEAKRLFVESRTRQCIHCSGSFTVKKSQIDSGQGKFCSQTCARESGLCNHLTTSENLKKAATMRARAVADGKIIYNTGKDSPLWKGGRKEVKNRRREKDNAYRNEYRKRNKEKCLEFTRKRRGLITGRLPSGTIKRIGESQRWKCVACKADIKRKYHMDHITPLAKGGVHEPNNIQLLCPKCNVTKSAKDPISFMQERGFLL